MVATFRRLEATIMWLTAWSLIAFLAGCGQGLFTRSRTSTFQGDGGPSDGVAAVDQANDGTRRGNDDSAATDPFRDGPDDSAPTFESMNIAAGSYGILELGAAAVTVRSMSFDKDIRLTIE